MFNKLIAGIVPYMPKKLVWLIGRDYIAGANIEDALRVAKKLNEDGIMTTLDVLGEFIENIEEAEKNKREYLDVIDAAEAAKIKGNYSLKPTSFGLLIDKDVAYKHIRDIVLKASSYNNFVRIDMEDSPCTDLEIELFRKLKEEFPVNVGLVFQAYMKRTLEDVKSLEDLHSLEYPINYRLCKGIYIEPPEIAYKGYQRVNDNYLKVLDYMMQKGMYPAIATHDKPLIEGAYGLIEKYAYSKEQFEFQMLYGVTPGLRKSILERGHRMRVYVPFGKEWFGYTTRRLKENPKMATTILKALFVKG